MGPRSSSQTPLVQTSPKQPHLQQQGPTTSHSEKHTGAGNKEGAEQQLFGSEEDLELMEPPEEPRLSAANQCQAMQAKE